MDALQEALQTRQDRKVEGLATKEARKKPNSPSPRGRILVKTFQETTYPAAAKRVFACHMMKATFDEEEGATITSTVSDKVLYVGNIGTVLPPEGTEVPAVQYGSRWIMNYNG
jgi:hypothetical protein